MQTATKTAWTYVRELLPEGMELPRAVWEARHRFILWVIAGNALALPLFGLYNGWSAAYSFGEPLAIAALGVVAGLPRLGRRTRATFAALALVVSSSVLVQFSGGYIEAHFHFFIVVALVALYQDWTPFVLTIVFVALEQGLVGTVAPHWVFNHEGGMQQPWRWALIHAVAILGECIALLAFWAGAEHVRARSDLVLDAAGEGVVGLDPDGRIAFANPAARLLLGRPEDQLVNQSVHDFVPAVVSKPGATASIRREGFLRRPDGSEVPIAWTLTPTLRAGPDMGSVMIVRDISERRAMVEQLRQNHINLESIVARRTAELTETNRQLEAFSYTVSHDLRAPLRGINGLSTIIQKKHGQALPAGAHEMLNLVRSEALRMGNLIDTILSLSRLDRVALRRQPLNLSAMAETILGRLAEKDPERRVTWIIEPGLAAAGDPGLVQLALENLLSNAWKFTGQTSGARISVRRFAGTGPATFVVEDNGAGFDMEHASELFQAFHRLHTPDQFEGTGVGLATVHRIVDRHGGRIWAEAAVSQGARFYFTLAPVASPGSAVLNPGFVAPGASAPIVNLVSPAVVPAHPNELATV